MSSPVCTLPNAPSQKLVARKKNHTRQPDTTYPVCAVPLCHFKLNFLEHTDYLKKKISRLQQQM